MFDFYVVCVRHCSISCDKYYWLPLKIYTSRSSCIRFINRYKLKTFDLPQFGILKISQDFIADLCEVKYSGKD